MRKKTKLLMEENNRLEKDLSQESVALLTDMVVYLRGSRISIWEQEQVRRDITQMLLDAEARGDKPQTVIGPDPKSLCDSIIEALPPTSPWMSSLPVLRGGVLSLALLTIVWMGLGLLENFIRAGAGTNLTLTLGQLFNGVGIILTDCILIQQIRQNTFSDKRKKKMRMIHFTHFICLFAIFFACSFLRQPVAILPVPLAVCGVVALLVAYKFIDAQLD